AKDEARSQSDGDLSEEIAGGLESEGVGDAIEREDFFDDRLDLVDLNSPNQLLEARAAADADAVKAGAFEHEIVRVCVALRAREHADQRNLSAPADALERARESADAPVFDYAIDAAPAGQLEDLLLPIGMRFVIHAVGRAEAACALDLFVAR